MRQLCSLAAVALATSLAAQDFIHYKFDSTCSNEVINYATGPQALPSNGLLESNSTLSPWNVGVFGGCLAGGSSATPTYYNRVVTGWNPANQNVTGDLTMAWFMKLRAGATPGTSLSYLMGAPTGGFRLFTNGVGGTGLYQRVILAAGGNGTNASIANDFFLPGTTFDVQAAAAQGWVHVAMVIDSTAQTADWYINGTSVLQLTNVPGALISGAGPFMVGAYSATATGAGSAYDIDEFIMSLRAYSPGEVLALSLVAQAGDGDYNLGSPAQCGSLQLSSLGGRPSVGNSAYALSVTPSGPSFYNVMFGFDRCLYAGIFPLPMDGGILAPMAAGCTVLSDNLISVGGIAVAGPGTLPFPIGSSAGFLGLNFYSQAIAIDLATFAISASNGFAIGIAN